MMKWEVLFYVTPSGQPVVSKFVQGLDAPTYAKTIRQIELLETYGTELGMPHAKSLGGGLIELRVRGKREVRIFYVYAKEKHMYLLHGFIKKTQQTPKKELDIARDRQKEIEAL
jgi:phage-related protein